MSTVLYLILRYTGPVGWSVLGILVAIGLQYIYRFSRQFDERERRDAERGWSVKVAVDIRDPDDREAILVYREGDQILTLAGSRETSLIRVPSIAEWSLKTPEFVRHRRSVILGRIAAELEPPYKLVETADVTRDH